MDDPRRIHEAKERLKERFAGKSTDELAMAAAINSEILLDSWAPLEDRVKSLEDWRLILAGGLVVVTLVVVPLFIFVVTGGT